MKWFKHLSGSLNNSIISEAIERFGGDGYMVFFGILEMVSDEFDIYNPGKLTLRMKKITKNLQLSRQKTVKVLRFFDEKAKTNTTKDVSFLVDIGKKDVTINCKRLADLCDNHTQKLLKDTTKPLQSSYEATSLQEVEVEVEVRSKNKRYNPKDFDLFYSLYPNKKEPKATLARWKVLLKSKELPDIGIIINALKKQIEWRENTEDDFIPPWKNPATWLNKGCWADEVETISTKLYTDAKRFLDKSEEYFQQYCEQNDFEPEKVREWITKNLS